MDLGSNESMEVFSINEGNEGFNSLVLEDLVSKKEDDIHNLWETWNTAHRTVLISLREKDTVMQKIVKEKDALAALKLTLLEEKNSIKDKQILKMQEKLDEKQTMAKEEQQSNEPKCSTPIIHKKDFGLKRQTPVSVKSKIIRMKSTNEILNLTNNLDQNKVAKKNSKNDETLKAVRRNSLTHAISQSSFQVDEEDNGIMENKPIYQIQEESMMEDNLREDTGHINDIFDDDRDGFENEPVYENIRSGRLSNISSIPPRNADDENEVSERLSNSSSISYKNAKKENKVSARFFNFIPILQKNAEKEKRVPAEKENRVLTDKETEVLICRMDHECNYSGSRLEKQIDTVHTTIVHLQKEIQTIKGFNQGLYSQNNQINTNGCKSNLSYRVSQLEKDQFQYRIEKLVDDKIKSLDSLIDEKAKSLDKLVDDQIKTLNRQTDDKIMSVDKSIEHRIRSEIKDLDYNIRHQSRTHRNGQDPNKNTRDVDILFKEQKILSDQVSNLTSGNNETITIVNRNIHDIVDIFSELSKIKNNIENHDIVEGYPLSLTFTPPSLQEERSSTSLPSPQIRDSHRNCMVRSEPSAIHDSVLLTEHDQSINLDDSDNSICGPATRLAASILEIQYFNEITDPNISVSARQAICSSPALRKSSKEDQVIII